MNLHVLLSQLEWSINLGWNQLKGFSKGVFDFKLGKESHGPSRGKQCDGR